MGLLKAGVPMNISPNSIADILQLTMVLIQWVQTMILLHFTM